jgi:hypothetical protein
MRSVCLERAYPHLALIPAAARRDAAAALLHLSSRQSSIPAQPRQGYRLRGSLGPHAAAEVVVGHIEAAPPQRDGHAVKPR